MIKAYSSSAPEATHIFVSCCFTTAHHHPLTCRETTGAQPALWSGSTTGRELLSLGIVRDKRDLPLRQGRETPTARFPATALPCATAWAEQTLQPCSLHATVWHWIWGTHDQRKDSTMGHKVDLVLRWSLGGAMAAIVSTYSTYQGDSGQHTLRKDVTCIHVKSSSPIKGIVQTQSV